MLKIKHTINGYILENYDEIHVVEEREDEDCVDRTERLLEKINELIGEPYDKFGEKNIYIGFKKGHKL